MAPTALEGTGLAGLSPEWRQRLVVSLQWALASGAVAAGLAFVSCLMGLLGGLVFSAIKRDRGVKDWGRMIEGHGGMLDRLDSVIFAAPIFFHLTRFWFVP